ncbi:hypothetical protein D3C78_1269850 [compost metagenome]
MISTNEEIRSGFASRIWTIRRQRRLFRKQSRFAKCAVYFIGGYLNKLAYLILLSQIQQRLRPQNIRLHKNIRLQNAPVHMRLCRKVNNRIDSCLKQRLKLSTLCDVSLHKGIVRMVLN